MRRNVYVTPFILPVAAFALTILIGALLLWLDASNAGPGVAFVDALFTATSAVCVTGLTTVDPSMEFNRFGQSVIILLMQLGGLGIMSYSTLIFYMWRRRITLNDRLAVGLALLHDSSFDLGTFLQRVALTIVGLELLGALALYAMEPAAIGPFKAVFLSVSAFCNAGIALWPDNLMGWKESIGVNAVVMILIVLGGLGFYVLDDCLLFFKSRLLPHSPGLQRRRRFLLPAGARQRDKAAPGLSRHSRLVLATSAFLIVAGALLLLLPEYFANDEDVTSPGGLILPSLFQSVTARTAGFATVNMAGLTDISLLVLMGLMAVGGSPGSCAGGIKTTTFRVLLSFCLAALRGKSQVVVAGRGVSAATLRQAFVLVIFALVVLSFGGFLLVLTESGAMPHGKTPFETLDLFFEVFSAFFTVGLSTGVTPQLTDAGKLLLCVLMYVGRLGPIWLITMVQQFQDDRPYEYPEVDISIG